MIYYNIIVKFLPINGKRALCFVSKRYEVKCLLSYLKTYPEHTFLTNSAKNVINKYKICTKFVYMPQQFYPCAAQGEVNN